MDQVAPRTTSAAATMTDEAAPIDNHAAISSKPFFQSTQSRSNPANVSVSHVTTSAEITNPSSSNIKLKSVPIPPPLLLRRPLSRSSMSSMDDDSNSNQSVSAASLPPQVPPSVSGKPILGKKKSIWVLGNSGDEMASSLTSEPDVIGTRTKTPPLPPSLSSSSTSPMYSLRYANSPPAGSGAKYMIKSKRSSWIVDAGAERGVGSIGGGVQAATASDTINSTPSTPVSLPETVRFSRSRKSSTMDENNSTRSKLRENNFFYERHQRTSSISSILTDNISILSGSDEYESCHDLDESVTSPTGKYMHDTVINSCCAHIVCVDINQNRRSSGCLLRNMSGADLADIINGSMPNPVCSHPSTIPEYQQSIQTFLKRQLSNSTMISPRSIPDADKDVVEIDLDDSLSCPYNNAVDTHTRYQSPVYPAIFLRDDNDENNDDLNQDDAPAAVDDIDMNVDSISVPDVNEDYFALAAEPRQGS